MNLSRAYSSLQRRPLGRPRADADARDARRARARDPRFVPEDYLEVVATFSPPSQSDAVRGHVVAAGRRADGRRRELAAGRQGSGGHRASASHTAQARIESIDAQTQRMPPPLLYDLTELQRHANRLFGFSAQRTLELAQALYERHKLISYPRTDSRHLSQDVARTLPAS